MARGGAIRRGLTIGLAAGVGAALVRAARARRAAPTTGAPPTWPPMPTALVDEPPSAEALVAEAAVLEAAGVTEAAEIDEDAAAAFKVAAAGRTRAVVPDVAADATAELDLEAIVLAEEAALEADRLEAERLELARLTQARARAEEVEAAGRSREQERQEALARFAAQREEAQRLLSLQEEREARATAEVQSAAGRRPLMAGDLDETERIDRVPDPMWPMEDAEDIDSAALEPVVPDDAVADLEEEPAWGVAVEAEPEPEPRHDEADLKGEAEVGAVDAGPEPTGRPGGSLEDLLDFTRADRTVIGDDATEDLDGDGPVHESVEDEAIEDEADHPVAEDTSAGGEGETWAAWAAANPASWADWAEDEDEDEDEEQEVQDVEPDRVPLLSIGELDLDDEDDDDDEDDEPVAPVTADEFEVDEPEPDPEPEPALARDDSDGWPPVDEPGPRGRRPLMTADFDDVSPEDFFDDDDLDDTPVAPATPLRRSGQPRVPLKARRVVPPDEAEDPAGAKGARVTKKTAAPKKAPVKKAATAKRPASTTTASKATAAQATVKKAAGTKKGASPKVGTASRRSKSKKGADVLWVEAVGDTCPPSHPVKAVVSRGIFHVVGGFFYNRCQPERCYRVAAAAEADGLRQAKR